MNKLNMCIGELEYEFLCEWSPNEYPQIGDSISLLHFCSEEQEKIFEQMPLPKHINNSMNFKNAAEYIDYRGFIVKYRMWGKKGILTLFLYREDD